MIVNCNILMVQDLAVECSVPKGSCLGSQSIEGMQRSKPKISAEEVIEAIFTVPERLEEEPKLKRYGLGANRNRVPHQKPVLKPLEDVPTYSTEFPINIIIGSKGILSILVLSLFSEFRLFRYYTFYMRSILSTKSWSSCLLFFTFSIFCTNIFS
jgi:hypothetical protein